MQHQALTTAHDIFKMYHSDCHPELKVILLGKGHVANIIGYDNVPGLEQDHKLVDVVECQSLVAVVVHRVWKTMC